MIKSGDLSQNSVKVAKRIVITLMLLVPSSNSASEGSEDDCSKLRPGYLQQILNSFRGYDDSQSTYQACILNRLSSTSRRADSYYQESQQTDTSYRQALVTNMVKYDSDPEAEVVWVKSLSMQNYQVVGNNNERGQNPGGILNMGEVYRTATGFKSIGSQTK